MFITLNTGNLVQQHLWWQMVSALWPQENGSGNGPFNLNRCHDITISHLYVCNVCRNCFDNDFFFLEQLDLDDREDIASQGNKKWSKGSIYQPVFMATGTTKLELFIKQGKI